MANTRLTLEQAVEITRRHGLTLSDAVAISQLADTEEEAERLASMFDDDGGASAADALAESILNGGLAPVRSTRRTT